MLNDILSTDSITSMLTVYMLGDLHISNKTPISRIDNYFDACFDKLEYVFQQVNKSNGVVFDYNGKKRYNKSILVLSGDIFHTPSVPDFVKDRFISLIMTYDLRDSIFTIFGNHDILYYNHDFNHKTSLNLMVKSGLITLLSEKPVNLGWFDLYGHTIKEQFPSTVDSTKKSLVVSHSFLNFTDDLAIDPNIIENSGHSYALLGHDHNLYPIHQIGECKVLRPGALMRGTSSLENQLREISYAKLVIGEDGEELNLSYNKIPHAEFTDIFRYKSAEMQKTQKMTFEEIKDFVGQLKNISTSNDPFELLKSLPLSKEVYESALHYLHLSGLEPA